MFVQNHVQHNGKQHSRQHDKLENNCLYIEMLEKLRMLDSSSFMHVRNPENDVQNLDPGNPPWF